MERNVTPQGRSGLRNITIVLISLIALSLALGTGTAVNNLFAFLELSGKLDLEALEKSANRILERHEVLRTKYHFGRGMPEIEILPHFTFKLPVIDLRKIELDKQRTEAQKLAEKVVLKPFNLTRAPLIHLNLFVLSNDVKLLLLIVHHTIADGWSLGVFLRELMVLLSQHYFRFSQ
jgi:NRPS condensation-like uncharacterized protein